MGDGAFRRVAELGHEQLLRIARSARLLGVYNRDLHFRIGRRLARLLRNQRPALACDGAPVTSALVAGSLDTSLVLGRSPPAALTSVALECLSDLACVDAVTLDSILQSVQVSFLHLPHERPTPSHLGPLLVRLLSTCSGLRLPVERWPAHPRQLLSLLDGVPSGSLSSLELVETFRSSATLMCELPDGSDECHDVSFSSQCRSLERALQGRISVAEAGLNDLRRGENHLVLLANFATIDEVLRRARPASTTQNVCSTSVGRSLRKVASAPSWVPPSVPAAVAMVRWCSVAAIPPSESVLLRLCSFTGRYADTMVWEELGDAVMSSLGALGRSDASHTWAQLLSNLCGVLRVKLHLVPAETLLCIVREMLFAMRRLHPRAQTSGSRSGPPGLVPRGRRSKQPRERSLAGLRATSCLRRNVAEHVVPVLARFVSRPALLGMVSQRALLDAARAARVPATVRVSALPSVLVPTALPWVQDLRGPPQRVGIPVTLRGPCIFGRSSCKNRILSRRFRRLLFHRLVFLGLCPEAVVSRRTCIRSKK